jgi:quercetin dioxygenase-like cupin family protein
LPLGKSHSAVVYDVEGDAVSFLGHILLSEAGRALKQGLGNDDLMNWMEAVGVLGAFAENDRPSLVESKPMSKPSTPIVRVPGEGWTIAVVGDIYRFLATGEDTSGKYAMWEALVPPGGGPPPHVHSREEESFFILEGEITLTVGKERIVASAGMFANMPVGTQHSFKNEGRRSAKMLISVAPAGLEKMFLEFGVPLEAGATTALPPTKEEIEKLLAVAPMYGIEITLPGK